MPDRARPSARPLTGQGEREVGVVVRRVDLHRLGELAARVLGQPRHEQRPAERLPDRRLLRLEPLGAPEHDRGLMGMPVPKQRRAPREQLVGVLGRGSGFEAEPLRSLNASPYNVIRLDLGEERPGVRQVEDKYRRAASELRSWRDQLVLVPTNVPSYFAYEMRFSLHGTPRRIRGLVCAVELEDWGGSIVPHERTMKGPVQDRLEQLRAARTNLSCIHAVFRGPSAPLAAFLDAAAAGSEPHAMATDEAGVEHRLWICPPGPEVAGWLADEPLMISHK